MLQLELDFNIRALEVLVIPEVVDVAIVKVEAEVAVDQEMIASKGVTIKEAIVVEVTTNEGVATERDVAAEEMA